jgi:hypothetical protein
MQMRLIDLNDTTVSEVHEHICDTAVEIANRMVDDPEFPRKWRGTVFMNGAPYNDGKLVLEITDEFQGAPEKVKKRWRQIAVQAVQSAIVQHQELFAGLILGEAKQGRNYFHNWPQAPAQLF